MSWQAEVRELVAYGKRIGLGFDEAWRDAVACVDIPGMCCRQPVADAPGQLSGQLSFDEPAPQSVLAFFKGVCRRSWAGEEVAPAGCFDTVTDGGGVAGVGKSRGGGR